MLNLKKVIALVCVFAMMLTTVAFGATYSDVAEDSAYYEAVETLTKLGIVSGDPDGTYRPEDGVTRAEMAKLIACIQGYGETAKNPANTAFTDVPANYWASGYIANAAGMGIINGYGDGTFGPEDPVLYEQAVKMIMATLGYTPFAEKNGGYPTGYLAAAQRYDVSLAVANAAVGTEANRGTIAQLLENALDTPLMVQSSWNTNGEVTYVIADGKTTGGIRADYKTLMSENLGYVKVRGVVTDAGLVTTETEGDKTFDTTDDPAVVINVIDAYQTDNVDFAGIVAGTPAPKKFLTGTTDAADYLGRSVIGYVKKLATDEYELVSIAVDTNRNDELVIDLGSYAGISSTGVISYYKDGANDTTEVDTEKRLKVVYNNECIEKGDADYAAKTALDTYLGTTYPIVKGGAITLIDNDDDKGYDVAIVDIAATAVVKKVTEDGISFYNSVALYGGNTKTIDIDVEDETKVVAIYKDGEMIAASDLVEWDVLSVYAVDEDSNVIVAEVVANQVVGTITSTKASKTSFGGTAYKVADTWYDVAAGVYDEGMAISEGGTFYIDEFGKIAAFVEDAALAGGLTANYAYVLGIDAEPASFGATGIEVNMQVVTADGVVVMPVKNNTKVKGATYNFDLANWADDNDEDGVTPGVQTDDKFFTGDTGYSNYTTIESEISAKPVIKYTKNSAGYITEITLADYDSKFVDKSVAADGKFDAENSKFVVSTSNKYVDEDAIVFIIDTTEASECYVGTLADLESENTYTIYGAYADNKADSINVLAIEQDDVAAAGTTANLAVVTGVGYATTEDGEAIYEISYLVNGEEKTAKTTADAKTNLDGQYSGYDQIAGSPKAAALTAGDIVKIKIGSDGLIANVKLVYDFAEDIRTASAASATKKIGDGTDDKYFGGVVTGYTEKTTEIWVGADSIRLDKAANIYVVDNNGNNLVIEKGDDSDFKYFEALYASPYVAVDIYNKGNNTSTPDVDEIATAGAAQAYADHIYVMTYEDKPTDVIIVKGADIKVKVD